MLTKAKAMYQTWLIIEGLPKTEQNLISRELLEEIESSMEYDENITIDFDIPLEKQNLDEKTWSMLEKVLKSARENGYQENKHDRINDETNNVEKIKLKNITLTKQLQEMTEKSKDLIKDYKKAFETSQAENEKLKKNCEDLISSLNKIPKWIRRIFLKDEKIKLLVDGKNE